MITFRMLLAFLNHINTLNYEKIIFQSTSTYDVFY